MVDIDQKGLNLLKRALEFEESLDPENYIAHYSFFEDQDNNLICRPLVIGIPHLTRHNFHQWDNLHPLPQFQNVLIPQMPTPYRNLFQGVDLRLLDTIDISNLILNEIQRILVNCIY